VYIEFSDSYVEVPPNTFCYLDLTNAESSGCQN